MQKRKLLAAAILLPFAALTAYALMNGGISGILSFHNSPGGWQVFIDLVIALPLLLPFLVPDAQAHGRHPWIWVVLTLCLGSFGPLLYLITRRAGNDTSGGAA